MPDRTVVNRSRGARRAATATSLTVTVPVGAKSGYLYVTTAVSTAKSSSQFVVLLPQTSSEDAIVICDRVRERVDSHVFGGYGGAPRLHITVSIGTTSYPDNGLTTDELLNAVDSALYTAKGSGKNQVATV